MLIDIRLSQIKIRKSSLSREDLETLLSYLMKEWNQGNTQVIEEDKEIIVAGQPSSLFILIYRLSFKYDIELM